MRSKGRTAMVCLSEAMSLTININQMNPLKKATPFIAVATAPLFLIAVAIFTAPKAEAGGVYVNGHGGGAVVRTGPAPRYYAPHTTTVKHNNNKDTVKVCREYYYGTKNCAKWSY